MANPEISNRRCNGVVILSPVFADATLTAAGAATWPAGAVLGKVTASGKYVRFDSGAADGSEVPSAVLTQAVEFTAAGDRAERPAISGQLRRGDLVDSAGAALTDAAVDQLRDFTILALTTHQLSAQDNQ